GGRRRGRPEPRRGAWLPRLGAPPVREEVLIAAGPTTLHADLYRPPQTNGALLLVHGLSPAGRRHAELVRLARLLAREGKLVLVPEFEGLTKLRLSGREVEEVRIAVNYLTGRGDRGGGVGVGFGGGAAPLAAAHAPSAD